MMIKTLFISDKLFRAKNAEQRKYYVDLYTKAKKQGVEIVQFGAMTPNGNRLNGMTGIAAILRMAMPDLDDLLESSDEGDIDSDNESGMCEVIPSDSESI
jgi:protein pelota